MIRPDGYSDDESNSEMSDYDDEYGFSVGSSRIKRRKNTPPLKDPLLLIEESIQNSASLGDLLSLENSLNGEIKIDLDSLLPGGLTALMCAAEASHGPIVKFLLEKGANPNIKCDSLTALMYVCKNKTKQFIANYECVHELLKKNASVNIVSKYGCTALMMAIQTGKEDVAKALIPKSNLSIKDARGWTAAIYAVKFKEAKILRLLANNGANLEEKDIYQNSIKEMAKEIDHQETIDVLKENWIEMEEEYEGSYLLHDIESWHDMFPAIMKSSNMPAYSNDIPMLLHGMRCERLQSYMREKSMDLETFLCLGREEMLNLFEILPFEQKRILSGLYKFHTRRWKLEAVTGLRSDKKIDLVTSLTYLGSHLKQMTVLKSSIYYTFKNLKFDSAEYSQPEYLETMNALLKEISISRNDLRLLKIFIKKINSDKPIPADLITSADLLLTKPNKIRNKLLCILAITIISVTAVNCHRGKYFTLFFKIPTLQWPLHFWL